MSATTKPAEAEASAVIDGEAEESPKPRRGSDLHRLVQTIGERVERLEKGAEVVAPAPALPPTVVPAASVTPKPAASVTPKPDAPLPSDHFDAWLPPCVLSEAL